MCPHMIRTLRRRISGNRSVGRKRTNKIKHKEERKLTSASRRFYTLAGRFRGSIVCKEISDLYTKCNRKITLKGFTTIALKLRDSARYRHTSSDTDQEYICFMRSETSLLLRCKLLTEIIVPSARV